MDKIRRQVADHNRRISEQGLKIGILTEQFQRLEVTILQLSQRVESWAAQVMTMVSGVSGFLERVERRLEKHERIDALLTLLIIIMIASVWLTWLMPK